MRPLGIPGARKKQPGTDGWQAEEFPLKLNHAGYIPNLLRSPVVFRGFTTRIFTSVVGGSELNLHLPTNYHSKSYPFLFGRLEGGPFHPIYNRFLRPSSGNDCCFNFQGVTSNPKTPRVEPPRFASESAVAFPSFTVWTFTEPIKNQPWWRRGRYRGCGMCFWVVFFKRKKHTVWI